MSGRRRNAYWTVPFMGARQRYVTLMPIQIVVEGHHPSSIGMEFFETFVELLDEIEMSFPWFSYACISGTGRTFVLMDIDAYCQFHCSLLLFRDYHNKNPMQFAGALGFSGVE